MKTLAKRLAWARARAGLSQQELADLAGVSQSSIGNLESEARRTSRKITSIAAVLGVDTHWLADGKGVAPTVDSRSAGVAEERKDVATPSVTPVTKSAATAHLLNILAGRSEDDVERIARALEILLEGTNPRPQTTEGEVSFTVGTPDQHRKRTRQAS